MNFLTHYYLHRKKDDNHFTVGLTLPDLFSFISRKIRISHVLLEKIYNFNEDQNQKSLICGMSLHLQLDKWFHKSTFFYENVIILNDECIKNSINDFPSFLYHVLLEIFIDRYLLKLYPSLADEFYESYKKFNFPETANLFTVVNEFNKDEFVDFAIRISNSNFLREYVDCGLIISILNRIGTRIVKKELFPENDISLINSFNNIYDKIEVNIKNFFDKEEWNDHINLNPNLFN
ncbi:MAG: hypothetical protein A2086_06680 [Spirochaetes bacterium GWD1_27_9]|nr:MAG: hypothetical protein A2Z98_00535 [Spirochaetes bacterium GWB1_27_13]OHD20054.1 MAG: hypothetical protein A2Y34_08090 [Spirochaetes bacterium GWC1_27_15]OHD41324.1 MAG: hypothetical protein A2086_06680 [Spirochaetes bacterium GWD1_27_9]